MDFKESVCNGSLELIDELDEFLGNDEDSTNPSARQKKKEMLLQSISSMLEKPEENGKNAKEVEVPRMDIKSCKASQRICFIYFVLLCIFSFCVIKHGYCQGKSMKLCWSNNIQDWIYPVLRGIRLLALPVMQYFPSISDLHEETCLVENPFYWDREVDCTLCQDVAIVTLSEAHHFEELFYHKGVPVVVQDAVPEPVSLSALRHVYNHHRSDITAGSSGRLVPAPPGLDTLDRLLATPYSRLADMPYCIQWRLLRVSAVKHLRKLFVRPYFVTKKTEVSLHRYIYICGDQGDDFPLPVTEFANVWISQHSGTRLVRLTPSSECSDICRPLSALLRPGETLFYNWRYWRAVSLPVDSSLLQEADAAWDEDHAELDLATVDAPADTCSAATVPESWWQPGGSAGEQPYESGVQTDAQSSSRQGSAVGEARDTPAAVPDRGERVTTDPTTGGSARHEVRPTPPRPTVSITFVGSFY